MAISLSYFVGIVAYHILPNHAPAAGAELVLDNPFLDLLNPAGGYGLLVQHYLQAVVLGRVVAAGNHDAGPAVQVPGGKVHQRSGHLADVDNIAAAFHQCLDQAALIRGTGLPAVAADDQGLLIHFAGYGANGLANATDQFIA